MKRLIILLSVVLLLVALLVIYITLIPKTPSGESDDIESESDIIMIAQEEYTDMTELTSSYNGEIYTLISEGGKWYWEGDKSFPLNQEIAVKMSWAISDIGAMREISDEDASLSDYGLDDPEFTISVKYISGTEKTYHIGALNTFNDSRYLYMPDTEKIYNISSALTQYFEYGLYDMIIADALPEIDVTKVKTLEHISGDENVIVEDQKIIEVFIATLSLGECVDYNVSEEDAQTLEGYGLSEDERRALTINYYEEKSVSGENSNISSTANIKIDQTYTIYFGKSVPGKDGMVYAKIKDSNFIYEISESLEQMILPE